MATYNGEQWLEAQLNSLVSQTLPPDEIVILDDCSTDSTYQLASKFAHSATISASLAQQKRNVGYVANFSEAMSRARNDIVLLCDQDDLWCEDKIERLVAPFCDRQVSLAFSDALVCDERLTPLRRLHASVATRVLRSPQDLGFMLLRRNLVPGMTIAIRRVTALSSLPVPDGWHHDHWIATLAAWQGATAYVNEPLVLYRSHHSQKVGPSEPAPSNTARLRRAVGKRHRVRAEALRGRRARLLDVHVRLTEVDPAAALASGEALAVLDRLCTSSLRPADLAYLSRRREGVLVAVAIFALPGRLLRYLTKPLGRARALL